MAVFFAKRHITFSCAFPFDKSTPNADCTGHGRQLLRLFLMAAYEPVPGRTFCTGPSREESVPFSQLSPFRELPGAFFSQEIFLAAQTSHRRNPPTLACPSTADSNGAPCSFVVRGVKEVSVGSREDSERFAQAGRESIARVALSKASDV